MNQTGVGSGCELRIMTYFYTFKSVTSTKQVYTYAYLLTFKKEKLGEATSTTFALIWNS